MNGNKVILLTRLFIACFLSLGVNYSLAQKSGIKLYEAENADNTGLVLLDDSTASSGKFLRMKDTGIVSWHVLADTTSWHELTFRYRAFNSEEEEYVIRNGYRYAVGFGISDNWSYCKTPTCLQKGPNKVELKASWGNIDIDFLEVSPVDIKPTIKPLHNIFYREFPRDLFLKINLFGRKIKSVRCGSSDIRFGLTDFSDYEDAAMLRIPQDEIVRLKNGLDTLRINFDNGYYQDISVQVVETRKPAGLTIIAPDIGHGASVIIILPSKKVMLIDCGQAFMRDSIIIPLIRRLKIDTIHYFILTHYHSDHDSGDRGEKIKNLFSVMHFWDYRSFHTGQEIDLDSTHVKILNSYEDGEEENTRSLSFKLEYNGFKYIHGGDTYDINQKVIMKRFPGDVEAEVFYANHHFHGSVDIGYLRALNPVIVLFQSDKAVYARSAYMDKFKNKTEKYFTENQKRYEEDLPAFEVGTIIIRVDSKSSWTYETNRNVSDRIGYIFK
jgi:beta-lactamase superfamily II metal-dependent hydrolase